MVLVDHDGVESDLFDCAVLDHPLLVQPTRFRSIKVFVREQNDGVTSVTCRMIVGGQIDCRLLRIRRHGLFGEIGQ